MASIQCAIELYDGVTPVLRDMAGELEGFSERFSYLGSEMQEMMDDARRMNGLEDAFGGAIDPAQGIEGALEGVYGLGEHLAGLFSAELFAPIAEGVREAILTMEEVMPSVDYVADGLRERFLYASEAVQERFFELQDGAYEVMQQIAGQANAVAARLPRYFAAPLAQISGMFASMASAATASLQTIIAASAQTVQTVQGAQRSVQVSPTSAFSVPSSGELGLPAAELMGRGASLPIRTMGNVAVYVQNENHIAADVDVERVLGEMEIRLADAVAMSMEGVYA